MKGHGVHFFTAVAVTFAACDRVPSNSSGYAATQALQAQAHADAYESQLKASEDQLNRQNQYLETTERQMKRMEDLLQKWEEQAKRYDAILTRWEQQPAPGASSKQQ